MALRSNKRLSQSLFVLALTLLTCYTLSKTFLLAPASDLQVNRAHKPLEPLDPIEYWTYMGIIILLVPLGGVFAGLTTGILSLDDTNLSIIRRSGSARQKAQAAKIEPLRKNIHLLLVTLLLSNTIINETLPVLFHTVQLDGYQAVLASTALILLFGEIIPQALCNRYGLAIGAFFSGPLRVLMALIWIVAYPIAKLLDYALGHHHGVVYRRAGESSYFWKWFMIELRELVALHGEESGGTLTKDEVSILRAVLEIRDKTVKDIMTRLEDVFMLELDSKLDRETLEAVHIPSTLKIITKILQAGHSRIPVYMKTRNVVIGVILVKQLIMCDPKGKSSLNKFQIRKLPRIKHDTPLFEILHVFEEGGSHMALVVEETTEFDNGTAVSPIWTAKYSPAVPKVFKTMGIVTLEDVIEELLGQEIIDETDVYIDVGKRIKVETAIKDIGKLIHTGSKMIDKEKKNSLLDVDIDDGSKMIDKERKNSLLDVDERTRLLSEAGSGSFEALDTPIYDETTRILSNMLNPLDVGNREDVKIAIHRDETSPATPRNRSFKKKNISAFFSLDELGEAVVYGQGGASEVAIISTTVEEVPHERMKIIS